MLKNNILSLLNRQSFLKKQLIGIYIPYLPDAITQYPTTRSFVFFAGSFVLNKVLFGIYYPPKTKKERILQDTSPVSHQTRAKKYICRMKYKNILEEELKNKVAADYFGAFDCTSILQKIDFSVKIKNFSQQVIWKHFLWAEAKKNISDICAMLSQLVLTIGKARTFDKILPPPFLGCFDCEKIAFFPYYEVQEIFYINDFNWNVTPSNRETREFKLIYEKISQLDDSKIFIFDFEKDEKELKKFIKENFIAGKIEASKIKINKNNFIHVYNKWLETVKPTIMLLNWEKANKAGIIDGDFYLADLLSNENQTLKEKLFVVLRTNKYELNRHENEMGIFTSSQVDFSDNQRAHTKFGRYTNVLRKRIIKERIQNFGRYTNVLRKRNIGIISLKGATFWCRRKYASAREVFILREFGLSCRKNISPTFSGVFTYY